MNKNILFFTPLLAVGISINIVSSERGPIRKDPCLRLATGVAIGIAGFIAFHAITDELRSMEENRKEEEWKKAVLKEAEERRAKGYSCSANPIDCD